MNTRRLFGSLLLCIFLASAGKADWRRQLDSLIRTDSPIEQARLIDALAGSGANYLEIIEQIDNQTYPAVTRPDDGIIVSQSRCIDGVERPWALYMPTTYDPAKPTPFLVVLHGGVSRPHIMDDPRRHAREHYLTRLGEQNGWIVLYPSGQAGAEWWDEAGLANIRHLIREVKRGYNIDDTKVWMAGFSDGGSGAFLQAMTDPGDLAAFVALNCNLAVGSLARGLHIYPGNMANRPVYAITNDRDRLYPTNEMAPIITMALRAGAAISYKRHEGGHDLSYGDIELPLIAQFLRSHSRDNFPDSIVWESADSAFGRFLWFAIDEAVNEPPQPWHRDYNLRVMYGPPDDEKSELLLRREKPSAKIIARAEGNTIRVEASRLKSFRVLIAAGLFDLSRPIAITVNGREVFNAAVKPDIGFMLRDFLNNRDRDFHIVNEIKIRL